MNLDELIERQMDELAVPIGDGVEGMVIDYGTFIEVGMIRACPMMRGDEAGYWGKAIQHDRHEPEAGL